MNDYPSLYRGSLSEARERDQISLWKDSMQQNIVCKQAIEEAIRRDFDGMHLQPDCVESVIREFGFLRTAWVLANTLQQKDWDGRFSPGNRAWTKQIPIPDESSAVRYVVESHPAVLDGFVSKFREIFQRLGLFGAQQCEPDSYDSLDYEGKVLVLSPIFCGVVVGAVETSCGWHWTAQAAHPARQTSRCGASAYGTMRSQTGTGPNSSAS